MLLINPLLLLFAIIVLVGLSGAALIHTIVDAIRFRSWSKLIESTGTAAYQLDIFGNVAYAPLLNAYFIREGGYHFGVKDETVSSALGKNWTLGSLTWLGEGCVGMLNLLDRDHCYKYIIGSWHLPKPGRIAAWKTLVFSVILAVIVTLILKGFLFILSRIIA